jgi:hypothetical protein
MVLLAILPDGARGPKLTQIRADLDDWNCGTFKLLQPGSKPCRPHWCGA